MPSLTISVLGTPQPQGSKSGFVNPRTGRVVMVEAVKGMKPWREQVTAALKEVPWVMPDKDEAVTLEVSLVFERPKTAKRPHMTTKPDADKCLRLISDAATLAGIVADDSSFTRMVVVKSYGSPARADITIRTGE